MDLYQAISQMREISKRKGEFSFSFLSYNRSNQTSEGIIGIPRARLRQSSREEDNQNADIMLNYIDLDTNEARQCYQPLLISFNGKKLVLQ